MKTLGAILLIAIALSNQGVQGFPRNQADDQEPAAGDDSDMYLEPQKEESREGSQQTFYPSFSPYENPPLGHSRPFYYQPEAAYSHRPQSGYQQQQVAYDSAPRYSGYKDEPKYQEATHGLLGSGNFGVIRGGTFYDNDGDTASSSNYDRDYSSYFRNGHGRPSQYYGGVPNPKAYQHEQFENFRDFADINTPTNAAYSQFVVVYVNKNATKHESTPNRPKNIIESLALLDLEKSTVPEKKLSKTKEKLSKLKPEKKHKVKKSSGKSSSRDLHEEPLLALS